jgi:hypothetical protein
VLAAGFTLVIVQWSLRHGRLILPPTYDDVGYIGDGLARRDVLDKNGMPGVVADYFRRPPHSPFSSYLALASFVFFGAHDWAPYAGNVVLVLAILGFVECLMRGSPSWARAAVAVFVLTVPVTGEAVAEFRPDFAAGLVTAMGVVCLLQRPLFAASKGQLGAAGASFGLSLLFKPTAFSLTLAALGLALVLATITDLEPRHRAVREVALRWSSVLGPAGALGLPHYAVTGRYYYDYFQWNILGSSHPWRSHASRWEQLTYYVSGPGGQAELGRHLYVLVGLAVVGAAMLARRNVPLLTSLRNQAIVAAAALAIPSLHPVKQIFFAVTFAFLLVFMVVQVLAALSQTRGEAPADRRPLAGGALVLVGMLCAQWPVSWGDRSDPSVRGRNRLADDILRTLRRESQARPARVFVTAPGGINPDLLQYMARRDGLPLVFSTLCGPHVGCIYLSDDVSAYRRESDQADYVLLGEPGQSEAVDLPSARVQEPLLAMLRSSSDYAEKASFPTLNDKSFLLFQNVRVLRGGP